MGRSRPGGFVRIQSLDADERAQHEMVSTIAGESMEKRWHRATALFVNFCKLLLICSRTEAAGGKLHRGAFSIASQLSIASQF